MGAQGTAVLNFGSSPGQSEATVAVTGQAAILTTSHAEAFIMEESTGDNTADDHGALALFGKVTCTVPVAATGFTIRVRIAEGAAKGTYNVRWVWN